VATKLHNQMTGADLHPNAIDGTTGTELTPSSQAAYDSRWLRTTGGTVTPTNNSTTTLKVTKADGTTQIFDIDTTNARVGVGTVAPTAKLSVSEKARIFDATPTNADGTTDAGYLFGTGIPAGLVTEVSGQILTLGINTSQVGTQDNTRSGGIFRFDSRAGQDSFSVIAHSSSSGTLVNRLVVGLGSGDTRLAPAGGNTGVGLSGIANSILQVAGAIATAITTSAKTTAYTATAADSTILADTSGGTFQITLPNAAGITGRSYTIKRVNATNNVTVGTSGGTIDGAAAKTLGSQYATLTLQSDGTNYQILSTFGTVS